MTNEEDTLASLICSTQASGPALVRDSVADTCAECGCGIWVAPSGREIVAEQGARLLCLGCGMVAIATSESPVDVIPLSREQMQEIANELRGGAA